MESLDLRGKGRWATGVVGDWAHRPLVIYDDAGDPLQAVLSNQVFAYVGASAVWADRWRLAASFPLVLINGGEERGAYATGLNVGGGVGVGDLRLSGDVRLLGQYREAVTLAAGVHVHAPTGSAARFTGDDRLRAQPHLLIAGDLGRFEYAFKTGVNLRPESALVGATLGSEWVFGLAGGMRFLEDRLLVGPEVFGGTLLDSSFGVFDQEGTPIEALLGAHYRIERWAVGLGAGPGLSRGLGTPTLRALASLEWAQSEELPIEPAPPSDADRDSIVDADDLCPTEAAGVLPDAARRGCPRPPDSDSDTILDMDDSCPKEAGPAATDPARNGCPTPAAPPEPAPLERCAAEGTEPGHPRDPACPMLDRDADGVEDTRDACPNQPGTAAQNPALHGCPRVILRGDRLELLAPVEFESNRAELLIESAAVLEEVAQLLRDHPEISRVDIQGHTDARGAPARNLELSTQRAAAVRAWLIAHGVAAEKLESHGHGSTRPVDNNETDLGRQHNRRVEFHVTVER